YLPPQKQRFKLLITTRKYWLSESFSQLRLEVLNEDSALELLEVLIGNSRLETQIEEAKQLCEWLGYLPLGLELVGRFLKRRSEWTLERMIQELEKQALNFSVLQNPQGEMTAQRGVAAAFELSWNELDERGRYLGCLLSTFALAPIHWDLVEKYLSKYRSQEKGIIQKWFPTFLHLWFLLVSRKRFDALDSKAWEDIREDSLLGLNLIQKTAQGTYELHQLVRRYFQDKLNKMKKAKQLKYQFCQVIISVENDSFYQKDFTVELFKELEMYIPHLAEVAENLNEYLSYDSLTVPFDILEWFYKEQGLYLQAQLWLEKKKEIALQRLHKYSSDLVSCFHNLASLYMIQGRFKEAESLSLQSLEMAKNWKFLTVKYFVVPCKVKHPHIAQILHNLASIYRFQERYEEAETLFLQSLEIHKNSWGTENHHFAIGLNSLATLYNVQGRHEEAESLLLQSLEILKKPLGKGHQRAFATNLSNWAELFLNQGR
ncbi:MAG: tetratricopeptide repeat protein, partial [Trichodesmium sp. St16_bin2-tuft]|nr:tetratricopeptide repeat protein [Trichodesmium sp. St16_bin2-tuft]